MSKLCFAFFVILIGSISHNTCQAQGSDSSQFELIQLNIPKTEMKFSQTIQLWDVVSLLNELEPDASRRNDMYIRRGRLAIKGTAFEKFHFRTQIAYDGIGKDKLIGTFGNPNDPNNAIFVVWDAYFTYKASEYFNATFGYVRPQVGRESITSAVYILGFEKGLTNSVVRKHMVGRSNGREAGLNLGGLYNEGIISLNYNLGFFNTMSEAIIGDGLKWSPLLTGRIALSLGDPEMEEYGLQYFQSYYGKRKGLTIAYNQSYQGETDVFTKNMVRGADLLLNYGALDIAAEYDQLVRDTLNGGEIVRNIDQVYSAKAVYNVIVFKKRILQVGYAYTESLLDKDQNFHDIGTNLLIYEDKMKLGLHYIWGREENDDYRYIASGLQLIF